MDDYQWYVITSGQAVKKAYHMYQYTSLSNWIKTLVLASVSFRVNFRNLMDSLGIKIVRALPRSPETGGRFERMHATLSKNLEMILRQKDKEGIHLDLDEALEEALNIYKYI